MKNTQPTPKILLYGSSILLERLASKLKQVNGWEVHRRDAGAVRNVDEIDFIVTDLCDVTACESLPMLSALPGVMLIGVDAIANSLTVLTGRAHPVSAAQDVLDTLKEAM